MKEFSNQRTFKSWNICGGSFVGEDKIFDGTSNMIMHLPS